MDVSSCPELFFLGRPARGSGALKEHSMSMSQTLAPHLPYLRRYARALTGSQSSGDAHVRAALTALLSGDQSLKDGVPPRVGLDRLIHANWQSGAEHYDESAQTGVSSSKSPEGRLKSLSASKRAALLL